MKTVGTKLDNSEYKIYEFCCNENGLTKSEQLRDLIKGFVNDKPRDEQLEINYEELEIENKPNAEGIITRVSYDDGKTWINATPIPELTNVTVSD